MTGSDLVQERIPAWDQAVEVMAPNGVRACPTLVIAVPACWIDVAGGTLDDLDAVAAAFRARHGFRLRNRDEISSACP